MKKFTLFLLTLVLIPGVILSSKVFAQTTNLNIFDDQLASGFNNWSWSSYVDLNNSNPVQSGSKSIGFYPTGWGALYLHTDTAIDTSNYSALTFALTTPYTNQKIQVMIYDSNGNPLSAAVSLDNFGGNPIVGSWKTYTIPLSSLNAQNKQIKGIVLQNGASYSEQVYVDNLALVALNIATPTPVVTVTPSPTVVPTATPTPTPIATQTSAPTPTPLPSLIPAPTPVSSVALNAYTNWKSVYVQTVSSGVLRVIRPENGNDTVSEGMGYGMLLSMFANDQQTFSGLWSYTQKYLDSKGLMNWQINSSGSVIGSGSATDADEDIAFALLRADQKWPGNGYGGAAKNMISSMLQSDVLSTNLINPGDNWGATSTMNPSYISPAYYKAFASFSGNSRWNDVANTNSNWLQSASNSSTGLVPDWLNSNLSPASISWDTYPNGFYYDALRTPIRLLMDYKWNNSQIAATLLNKENNFISLVGTNSLVSGYQLSGTPLTNYLDLAFLSSYTAMAQVNPTSQTAQTLLNSLTQNNSNNYFGTTLKTIVLFLATGAN